MQFIKLIGKIIGIIIFLIIIFIFLIYGLKPKWEWFKENGAAIQAITGIYLVLVTMIYAIFTKDMVEEMYKTRKQARQPFLRLQWYQEPFSGLPTNHPDTYTVFQIINVGDGPAVDLIFFEFVCCYKKWEINRITAVGVGGCASIGVRNIKCNGEYMGIDTLRKSLDPENKDYEIKVTYKNAANETLETEFKTNKDYNDKFRIVKWPRNFV